MLSRKAKDKTPATKAGPVKAASAPSSPLKAEGPAPSDPAAAAPSRPENPAKGKGNGKNSGGAERPIVNKKGQQCIHFFKGACARGDQCVYGHIIGTDGKPLAIAPELLACYDQYAAAKREAKKKSAFIEQADAKCYCLLDSGADALVLPKVDSIQGTDAQCIHCTRWRNRAWPCCR